LLLHVVHEARINRIQGVSLCNLPSNHRLQSSTALTTRSFYLGRTLRWCDTFRHFIHLTVFSFSPENVAPSSVCVELPNCFPGAYFSLCYNCAMKIMWILFISRRPRRCLIMQAADEYCSYTFPTPFTGCD
jgi:hypothetical protein